MRYWWLTIVFIFCLLIKAAETFGAETIPQEAYAIPVKQRTHLPPRTQVASLSRGPELEARQYRPVRNYRNQNSEVMISPMLGATLYSGYWNDHIENGVTTGVSLDIPLSESFSGELQSGYGSFNVRYWTTQKEFSQYWAGGGLKFYFTRTHFLRPFLGAGLDAIHYDNLAADNGRHSNWVGVTQASIGMDVHLSQSFALVARGGWHHPLVNRGLGQDGGAYTTLANLDSAMMNDDFFRLMGAVKIAL